MQFNNIFVRIILLYKGACLISFVKVRLSTFTWLDKYESQMLIFMAGETSYKMRHKRCHCKEKLLTKQSTTKMEKRDLENR